MGLYGPFTATAGTVQRCDVSQDAAGLYVINTSRFDLALAFESQLPGATTTFGGPPWFAMVPSGDRRGIRIAPGAYGHDGFPGYVWALPIDNTTVLAQSGTISTNFNFSIETYADPATMPPDYASPQRQDASSQPRVITVPAMVTGQAVGQTGILALGNRVILGLSSPFSAANLANANVNGSISSILITASPGAAAWALLFSLEFLTVQNDNVTIVDGPFEFLRAQISQPATGPNVILPFPLANPLLVNSGIGANAFRAGISLHATGVAGSPQVTWAIYWGIDRHNNDFPGWYGQQVFTGISANNPDIF